MLDMLARDGQAKGERARSAGRWLTLALALTVAVLVPVGMFAALTLERRRRGVGQPAGQRRRHPHLRARRGTRISQPFPAEDPTAYRYPVAYVNKAPNLYEKPRSTNVKVRIARRTDWDTPRALSVVRQDGAWLAVQVPELRNGKVGWIREDQVSRLTSVEWAVHVDLSKRELVVKRDGTPGAPRRRGRGAQGPCHAHGPLRGHRQAEGEGPRLALRLLRAGAHRPPDAAARRVAGG